MKTVLIIPAVFIVLLIGCHPEENPHQLKAVNQSLERANELMQHANSLFYIKVNSETKDPQLANILGNWNPHMQQVRRSADGIKDLIRSIKVELIKQSDSLKLDYVDETKQLHSTDGTGNVLLNKLMQFKDSIPAIVTLNEKDRIYLNADIGKLLQSVPLLSGYRDSLTAEQKNSFKKKWLEESFGHCSSLMAMIMLNKLESDVLVTEKTLVDYCYSHICIINVVYDKQAVIASLSSGYVRAGEPVELTVGMGAFTNDLKPLIMIDGKEEKLNDDAVAVHKFIANGSPGTHKIPVRVEYTKPDGSKGQVWKTVLYIIAEK